MRAMLTPREFGRALFYGEGKKRNYRKAFPLLLQAAREGHVHWQYLTGYALANGLGTSRNLKAARSWYARAAKRGHPGALFNLALMYAQGKSQRWGLDGLKEQRKRMMQRRSTTLR